MRGSSSPDVGLPDPLDAAVDGPLPGRAAQCLGHRMPPTHTDEGLVAAHRIRKDQPGTGVLLLSQHLDPAYAQRVAGVILPRVRPMVRRSRPISTGC